MIALKNKFHNFHSQTGQTSFQLLTEYIWHHSFQVEIDKNALEIYYRTLLFQIPPYILTHVLVFGEPKGSPNTSKSRQNIRRYLAEKCLIIYNYIHDR